LNETRRGRLRSTILTYDDGTTFDAEVATFNLMVPGLYN
jgi:hypothetical protein